MLQKLRYINKTDMRCDTQIAYKESYNILKNCGIDTKEKLLQLPSYQISLVHRKGVTGTDQMKDGTKALWNEKTQQRIAFEHEYTEFNENFKNTYLYQIYLKLQKKTNWVVGRFRLMWLNPTHCYRFHTDKNEPDRFHLALETNPQCLFFIPRFK